MKLANGIRLTAGILLLLVGLGISADGVLLRGDPLVIACGLAVEAVGCKALADFEVSRAEAPDKDSLSLLGGKMGANSTQALAITLFLAAFVFIAAAMMSGGGAILILIGIGGLAASCMLFLKAKPWEEQEN